MNRRQFLTRSGTVLLGGAGLALGGCRSNPQAQVLTNQNDMVGTRAAGAETFKPLIEGAVGNLLARQGHGVQQAGLNVPQAGKRICFVGIENKSAEDLGDSKEQLREIIDTRINQSGAFLAISPKFVQAGLRETRLKADDLFLPANRRTFLAIMEQQGQPFDYLLFATLTSGTTQGNGEHQRDYLLTMELVDIQSGQADKESATIRKGYYDRHVSKWMHK